VEGRRLLAFCFMDISTAAQYMKLGYRVRRTGWDIFDYVYSTESGFYGKTKDGQSMFIDFGIKDLVADDWEVITSGIISHFPITYSN
jgi:hypothetical protein